MTQRALGDAVGINYQKLQKYELGKDRIAVSTLHRIATALGVHPGAFFDGRMSLRAADPPLDGRAQAASTLLQRVRDPRVARCLESLIAQLGEGHPNSDNRAALPTAGGRRRTRPVPARATVEPLRGSLRQAGASDATAMARLLGQAPAEETVEA